MSEQNKHSIWSQRYGRKDGKFVYYTVKVISNMKPEAEYRLSKIVQACRGCIIVESCEQSFPRVLCEDLTPPIGEQELIKAAISFFFPHLDDVRPAFKCKQGRFCFLAQDIRNSISTRTLNIFDFEDFGAAGHKDLVWLGCFPMMRLLCSEVSSEVIEILKDKQGHDVNSKSDFARTTAAYMESQKYFSDRWSVQKDGKIRMYRVQQTRENQDALSRLVQICNGEIYVDHDPSSGPRLLCESLQKDLVADESLMFAALEFFFPGLKCIEPMRKDEPLASFCFKAQDNLDLPVIIVFGKEDFGQGFNLLLLGKFQFTPSSGRDKTLGDMVDKLISLTGTANDFALLAVGELKHIHSQSRKELGMPDDVDLIMTDVTECDGDSCLPTHKMLWPNTRLTRLILEGGGTVYDYRKQRDSDRAFKSIHVADDLRRIVNREEFMRAAIMDIYPGATAVRLVCQQPLACQCWTLALNGRIFLSSFRIRNSWKPMLDYVFEIYFFFTRTNQADLGRALENVTRNNYERLASRKDPNNFGECLLSELAKFFRARNTPR